MYYDFEPLFSPRKQIKGSGTEQSRRMTGGSARTVVKEETGEDSVGAKMMKLMGWTEGAAIGDRFKVNFLKLGRGAKHRFSTLSRSVPDPLV
jgi:hypothetical protein